jgi:hypothetical protein
MKIGQQHIEELKRDHDCGHLSMTENGTYYELGFNDGKWISINNGKEYYYCIEWDIKKNQGTRTIIDYSLYLLIKRFFDLGIKTEKARISRILDL